MIDLYFVCIFLFGFFCVCFFFTVYTLFYCLLLCFIVYTFLLHILLTELDLLDIYHIIVTISKSLVKLLTMYCIT